MTALAGPGTARAATCSLADGELEVLLAPAERATITREGTAVSVRTSLTDPCGVVELTQLDRLSVSGTPGRDVVVVDLAGGPLEGGLEQETGAPEVELVVDLNSGSADRLVVRAGAAGDTLVAGDGGIALNGDGDVDILTAGVEQLVLSGREGPDSLSGAGGRGTGGPATRGVTLRGGPGDDSLVGGRGPDRLQGGPGRDDLVGGGGRDVLVGGPDADREAGGRGHDTFEQGRDADGSDVLFGQRGRDTVSYAVRETPVAVSIGVGADDGEVGASERDRVASDIEVVIGGLADDVLRAPPRSTVRHELFGGSGADILFGGEGDDLLSGGLGSDTVSFTRARSRVRVDLRAGTARGMGDDRLVGVEDVVGSRFGDVLRGNALGNTLDGWRGADRVRGRAGDDTLIGGDGADLLRGDGGRDELDGEAGSDRLFGGTGRDVLDGGAGVDSCRPAGGTARRCERGRS